MRYELTQELLTGNALIDTEHKQLFDAINALMDACAQGAGRARIEQTVNFLNSYVNKHFSDEERLHELVPRLLLDFKLSIVDEEMKHTLQALANPEIANDPQRYMEIMQRYKELHETQSIMAQRAGDRVVLKI